MKRLCQDCRWFGGREPLFGLRCKTPRGAQVEMGSPEINGESQKQTAWPQPDISRRADWLSARMQGCCGREGRFWERRPSDADGAGPAAPSGHSAAPVCLQAEGRRGGTCGPDRPEATEQARLAGLPRCG